MMNYPLKPSEMFLNKLGNFFPIADLKEQLAEVKTSPHKYENIHWFGNLVLEGSDKKVEWRNTSPSQLVRKWPIIDNKGMPGVIEIFEKPKKDPDGKVYTNRYIIGTDTYDDDESQTTSLGSVLVMDTWTDRVVAEFFGRPSTAEFYETARRLGLYYRASNNYEQNQKGLFWHFEKKKSLHLLCDTPESLTDVADVTISKVGNKRKGTMASKAVNAYALRLILHWLEQPAYGEDEDSGILNLHKIRSIGLLNELIGYNSEGNFDRVSALGMLLILKEDKYAVFRRKDDEDRKDPNESNLSQDDFFTSRYNGGSDMINKSGIKQSWIDQIYKRS